MPTLSTIDDKAQEEEYYNMSRLTDDVLRRIYGAEPEEPTTEEAPTNTLVPRPTQKANSEAPVTGYDPMDFLGTMGEYMRSAYDYVFDEDSPTNDRLDANDAAFQEFVYQGLGSTGDFLPPSDLSYVDPKDDLLLLDEQGRPAEGFRPSMRNAEQTAPVGETETVRPTSRPERATEEVDAPTEGDFVASALDTILKSEGGFQDDTEDTGNYRPDGTLIGTNRGITPRALAAYRGVDPNSITVADIKGVTEAEARSIYRQDYYERPKIDQLPEALREPVFDMYINAGGNAIKILQRAAGLTGDAVDGAMGPQTLAAIENSDITPADYADARIKYYKGVAERDPDKAKYLNGWIKRANKYR